MIFGWKRLTPEMERDLARFDSLAWNYDTLVRQERGLQGELRELKRRLETQSFRDRAMELAVQSEEVPSDLVGLAHRIEEYLRAEEGS